MRFLVVLFFAASTFGQTLPETPKPHKPISRTWIAEMSAYGGLYAADLTITAQSTNLHAPEIHSWLYGRYPSNQRLVLAGAAQFIGTAVISRFAESSKHRWVRIAGHAFAAYQIENEVVGIRSWTRSHR